MSHQVSCPSCGGPVEFKLGSSKVLACPWCSACVLRGGSGDLEAIGKVGELMPTQPPLNIGDTAVLLGREVVVGGRLQLDHGAGPWDEFYVEDTQNHAWAWLARAQGRWYFTSEQQPASLPQYEHLSPGLRGELPGLEGEWVVSERGESQIVSAEGELPHAFRSDMNGRYVDLSQGAMGFATIDFGTGQEPPRLYVGRKLEPSELVLNRSGGMGGMAAGLASPKEEAERLRCPTCGAPISIHVPSSTERVSCGSCDSLLDYQNGSLAYIKKLDNVRKNMSIPIGTTGTLDDVDVTVIGFMERATTVDFVTYRWREWLLFAEGKGFWWLLEDNGHFQLIKPIEPGEVKENPGSVEFREKKFRRFSRVDSRVETVIGEFYWKVNFGETAQLADFVKPPEAVSSERSDSEIVWSHAMHIEPSEVWKGLGLDTKRPSRRGVGVVQPNPWPWKLVALPLLVALVLCFIPSSGVGITLVNPQPVRVPPQSMPGPVETGEYAFISQPFTVEGPTIVEVDLSGNPSNQYVGANVALINTQSGTVHDSYLDFGYYSGVDGGYSWSEGTLSGATRFAQIPSGNYQLRVDPFWTAYPQPGGPPGIMPPRLTMSARTTAGGIICTGFFILLFIAVFVLTRRAAVETKRKENGNQ